MKSVNKLSLGFVTGFLTCFLFFGGTVAFAASGILAERSANRVFVDGHEVQLEAYLIEGHNYVQLRDVGKIVGFNVYWDGTVQIDSTAPYTGEAPAEEKAAEPMTITKPTETIPDASVQANPIIFKGGNTREVYNVLRQALETGTSGTFATTEATDAAIVKAAAEIGEWPAYRLSYPELGKAYVTANYSKTAQTAADFCQPFVDGLAGKSDREKVRQISYYVCDRLTYASGASPAPNTVLASNGVSKGNCVSYAHSFKFLCDMAGVPCIFTHSATHVWNQVYVEGQWWHVDLTGTDAGDSVTFRELSPILHAESDMQGADYRQNEPDLIDFAKELIIPGSTK